MQRVGHRMRESIFASDEKPQYWAGGRKAEKIIIRRDAKGKKSHNIPDTLVTHLPDPPSRLPFLPQPNSWSTEESRKAQDTPTHNYYPFTKERKLFAYGYTLCPTSRPSFATSSALLAAAAASSAA